MINLKINPFLACRLTRYLFIAIQIKKIKMKPALLALLILTNTMLCAQSPEELYKIDSSSVEHAGVPKGELIKVSFGKSKIYPGTWRDYWIYVPAQYSPDKPACLYLNQDGIQMKAPTVFDNLIDKKEMPVT